jgi:hypothetical protein
LPPSVDEKLGVPDVAIAMKNSAASGQLEPTTHVRFASKADKQQIISVCPLCAKRRHMRRSKTSSLDHLVGASEKHGRPAACSLALFYSVRSAI